MRVDDDLIRRIGKSEIFSESSVLLHAAAVALTKHPPRTNNKTNNKSREFSRFLRLSANGW
jgi:hypothetical protein